MEYNEKNLSQALENVTFRGFNKLNWQSIFKRKAIEYECNQIPKFQLARCIARIFIRNNHVFNSSISTESSLLFFNSTFDRKSNIEKVEAIASLVNAADIIQETSTTKKFDIRGSFILLFRLIPSWFKQLSKIDIPKAYRYALLEDLIKIYEYKECLIDLIHKDKYKALIVYYDSLTIDSYLVELFKSKGIHTISLEHGLYCRKKENKFINSGVELRSFKSDRLLCWNDFVKNEAISEGIEPNKLVVCGILGYISWKNYKKCVDPQNKIFGVVLCHPEYETTNIELIKSANILAKKKKLKFYLKLHPVYNDDHFDSIIDKDYCLGIIPKKTSVFDYAEMVEFSLVGNSTLLLELVYIYHKVIRYSDNSLDDKYSNVSAGLSFKNSYELINAIESHDYQCDALFKELCKVRDVASSYRSFLESLLIDKDENQH